MASLCSRWNGYVVRDDVAVAGLNKHTVAAATAGSDGLRQRVIHDRLPRRQGIRVNLNVAPLGAGCPAEFHLLDGSAGGAAGEIDTSLNGALVNGLSSNPQVADDCMRDAVCQGERCHCCPKPER